MEKVMFSRKLISLFGAIALLCGVAAFETLAESKQPEIVIGKPIEFNAWMVSCSDPLYIIDIVQIQVEQGRGAFSKAFWEYNDLNLIEGWGCAQERFDSVLVTKVFPIYPDKPEIPCLLNKEREMWLCALQVNGIFEKLVSPTAYILADFPIK